MIDAHYKRTGLLILDLFTFWTEKKCSYINYFHDYAKRNRTSSDGSSLSDPISETHLKSPRWQDHVWQWCITLSPRHCSQIPLCLVISSIFSTIFSPLHCMNSLEQEQKLELQPISQQDLSENWNTFIQNYSRFPSKACWSFSPCPVEACGSWLTSRFVPKNVWGKKKRKKNSRLHLDCPPWTTAVILLSGRLCRNLISTNRLLDVQKS